MSDIKQDAEVLPEVAGLQDKFADAIIDVRQSVDVAVVMVRYDAIVDVCHYLKDAQGYEQLVDLCGVDMCEHPDYQEGDGRYQVVYNLLSLQYNKRLRLKVQVEARQLVGSVVEVWPTANWFEREAFEMYGVIFNHHPDLRRILTDYGFEGYPMRKDFPVEGRVELFFDDEQWRCVYRPNEVENRVLIPKTWPGADRG